MSHIVNYLFYTLKPIIPRSVQITFRRPIAHYKRKRHARFWPIDPDSGRPPKGWRGWPGGKQFAFVLSHDVDTQKGYDNVLKLAELEEKMGFRSTFNFVPERYGKVSLDLLDELRRRGFAVAVHGLKHDGKLFRSKRVFAHSSKRINGYLQEWGTEGFTSPSMHHNLEWLVSLNIKYSISTFDTDPFEPQPDGVGTIFPFWVPNSSPRCGFVEMPLTLPQDSTLFIILQEKSIKIWKQKLDWVAIKGGMALINTHPDYMDFGDGARSGAFLYPIGHYTDFLQYVQHRYRGKYHHALAGEIAACFTSRCDNPDLSVPRSVASDQFQEPDKRSPPSKIAIHSAGKPMDDLRPLRTAMLTYSFYESDNRVRRYAESLTRRGHAVDVISLRRDGQGKYNELFGVKIHRVQERVRDEKGKYAYLKRIIKFFFRSAALLTRKHLECPYDLVHVHSVPDFEVFSALVPKLFGSRIILDIHDIVPELYCSKFKVNKNSRVFKALVLVEKASIGFSDHTIISNDLWRERLVSRSVAMGKCTSILNFPDRHLFCPSVCHDNFGKTILMYPGTLNEHQGLDIAVKAFSKIKDIVPHGEFHIYGDGPAKELLAEEIRLLGLQDRVFLKNPVPLDEIVGIMAKADIGVIPKKNDDFGGDAFSTKTLEFMTLGVPIILSRTRIDQLYFNDSLVKFFEPENVDELASAMLELIENKGLRERLSANGLEFARLNSWEVKEQIYLDLVDGLCRGKD